MSEQQSVKEAVSKFSASDRKSVQEALFALNALQPYLDVVVKLREVLTEAYDQEQKVYPARQTLGHLEGNIRVLQDRLADLTLQVVEFEELSLERQREAARISDAILQYRVQIGDTSDRAVKAEQDAKREAEKLALLKEEAEKRQVAAEARKQK